MSDETAGGGAPPGGGPKDGRPPGEGRRRRRGGRGHSARPGEPSAAPEQRPEGPARETAPPREAGAGESRAPRPPLEQPQRREGGPQRREGGPQRREGRPPAPRGGPQRREAGPQRREAGPQRREGGPTGPQRREAGPQRREGGPTGPQREGGRPEARDAARTRTPPRSPRPAAPDPGEDNELWTSQPAPPVAAAEAHRARAVDEEADASPAPPIPLPAPIPPPEPDLLERGVGRLVRVLGARFRPAGPFVEFECPEGDYGAGDLVMVEADGGPRTAVVAVSPGFVYSLDKLRRVLRRARPEEERGHKGAEEQELLAFQYCRERVREYKLPMKLIRAEIAQRAGRASFYFASEERIDFRDLIRDLTQRLRLRIELRQIGVRDEAKLTGGIGDCGRELCCSTWLPSFAPVSIKMAKDQGIVLNPARLAGQCGRLKCCLVYEHDTYKEMGKSLPKVGKRVTTPAGVGRVLEVDILRQAVRVGFEEGGSQVFPGAEVTAFQPPAAPPAES